MFNVPPAPLRLSGLVAATFTPMHEDGSLALDRVAAMVEHLLRWKIAALYVVGSTGEGVSLSTRERQETVEAFLAAVAGRIPVIVQVGHNSIGESRELAAHAERVGASAVSSVSPSYFKPASLEVLARTMAAIASAAPSLPFYYYHIPALTNIAIDMVEFLRLAAMRIPTLVGVKYTAPTMHELLCCVEMDDRRFEVLHGTDEMLLAGLTMGATAAVGSTYNYAAPIYHRVIAALAQVDLVEARVWQLRAAEAVRVILRYQGLSGQKAVMKLIGLDCGPTRLPQTPLATDGLECLRKELEGLGFFRWIVGSERAAGSCVTVLEAS